MGNLIHVSGTELARPSGDIVFVHGLGGGGRTTWQCQETGAFWPEWLGADLPEVAVWSLDYDAALSAWNGHAMSVVDRAANVLDLCCGVGIGSRPLVFIAHSLGGLVVKQLLREAKEYHNPEWDPFGVNTRGVVFLATPHAGSDKAGWVDNFRVLIRPNAPVEDLRAHASQLRDLNAWYQNNAPSMGIATKVYFETRKTLGLLIVDPTSANPGMPPVIPLPIDANHVDICKFPQREDQRYRGILGFVRDCITATRSSGHITLALEGSNTPALDIAVLEPSTIPIVIAKARDRSADMVQLGIAEASRLGVPNREWLDNALKSVREKWQQETPNLRPSDVHGWKLDQWGIVRRILGGQLSDAEVYATLLWEWYEKTFMELNRVHRIQTSEARTPFFIFTVSNEGRAPAENVNIYISFPTGLRLTPVRARDEGFIIPEPPAVPVSLRQEICTKFPKTDGTRQPWYEPSTQRLSPSHMNGVYLMQDGDAPGERQSFCSGQIECIEHGSRVVTHPIFVDLEYNPALSFEIAYRLRASNQPVDSAGNLQIAFCDGT